MVEVTERIVTNMEGRLSSGSVVSSASVVSNSGGYEAVQRLREREGELVEERRHTERLQQECDALRDELKAIKSGHQQRLADMETIMAKDAQEKLRSLIAENQRLADDLERKTRESIGANSTVTQLEAKMTSKLAEMQHSVTLKTDEARTAFERARVAQEQNDSFKVQVKELKDQVFDLTTRSGDEEVRWKSTRVELERRLNEVSEELNQERLILERERNRNAQNLQLKEVCIAELQEELVRVRKELDGVSTEWRVEKNSLTNRVNGLESDLRNETQRRTMNDVQLKERAQTVEELQSRLSSIQNESRNFINIRVSLEESARKEKEKSAELEQLLLTQRNEHQSSVRSKEERVFAVETALAHKDEEISNLKTHLAQVQKELERALQTGLNERNMSSESNRILREERVSLEKSLQDLAQTKDRSDRDRESTIRSLQGEKSRLERELETVRTQVRTEIEAKSKMQLALNTEILEWKRKAEQRTAEQNSVVGDLEGKLKVEEAILTRLKKESCIECVPSVSTEGSGGAKIVLSRGKFTKNPARDEVQKNWAAAGYSTMVMESEQTAKEWCTTPLALTHFDVRLTVVSGSLEFDFPETQDGATVSIGDELFIPARVTYALRCSPGTSSARVWLTYGGGVLSSLAVSKGATTESTQEREVGVTVTLGGLSDIKFKTQGGSKLKVNLKLGYNDFSTTTVDNVNSAWNESFPFSISTHTLLSLALVVGETVVGKAEIDTSELPMNLGKTSQSIPVKDKDGSALANLNVSFEPKQNMWVWRPTGHKTLNAPAIHTGYSFHPARQ